MIVDPTALKVEEQQSTLLKWYELPFRKLHTLRRTYASRQSLFAVTASCIYGECRGLSYLTGYLDSSKAAFPSLNMASIPALRDRVSTITDCIAQIDEFLSSTNTPQPSLSLGADPVFQLPADLDRTRQNALDACDELRALLQGPIPHLIGLVTKVRDIHEL